jgi:hypothetical protein
VQGVVSTPSNTTPVSSGSPATSAVVGAAHAPPAGGEVAKTSNLYGTPAGTDASQVKLRKYMPGASVTWA